MSNSRSDVLGGHQSSLQEKTMVAAKPGIVNNVAVLDQRWSLGLNKSFGSKVPRQAFMLLEHSGNGILWLVFAPTFWVLAPLSPQSQLAVANFFVGLWVDLALVGSLKGIVRRPRPEYNISGDFILVVAVDEYSFPSGHAAR